MPSYPSSSCLVLLVVVAHPPFVRARGLMGVGLEMVVILLNGECLQKREEREMKLVGFCCRGRR